MRLWSLHPQYLDSQGLVACWREALLAQAVLLGKTRGYTNHPQLVRFKERPTPKAAIGSYLEGIFAESVHRGYSFNAKLIRFPGKNIALPVTKGQRDFEWIHLRAKLSVRSPLVNAQHIAVKTPDLHPMFYIVKGNISPWEKGAS